MLKMMSVAEQSRLRVSKIRIQIIIFNNVEHFTLCVGVKQSVVS